MSTTSICAIAMLLACNVAGCDKKAESSPGKATAVSSSPSAVPLGSSGVGPRSCLNHDLCSEWQKLTVEEMLDARQDCNQSEGKFGSTLCPRDRAIASCSHESGGAVVYLYETNVLDLRAAEVECTKTQGVFARLKAKSDAGH